LMWTCVTVVYLIPAVILTTRLLAPTNSRAEDLAHSEFRDIVTLHSNPKIGEVL
jgi:hypothetical protein